MLFASSVRQAQRHCVRRNAPGDVWRKVNRPSPTLLTTADLRSRALCDVIPNPYGYHTGNSACHPSSEQCLSCGFHQPVTGKPDNFAVPVPAGDCVAFNGVAFFPQFTNAGSKAGDTQPESCQRCHAAVIQQAIKNNVFLRHFIPHLSSSSFSSFFDSGIANSI